MQALRTCFSQIRIICCDNLSRFKEKPFWERLSWDISLLSCRHSCSHIFRLNFAFPNFSIWISPSLFLVFIFDIFDARHRASLADITALSGQTKLKLLLLLLFIWNGPKHDSMIFSETETSRRTPCRPRTPSPWSRSSCPHGAFSNRPLRKSEIMNAEIQPTNVQT